MDRIISPEILAQLKTLPDFLGDNILGQEEVIRDVSSLLKRSFCRIRLRNRPAASMLFCGGTGVGKTQLCNLFTQHLFEGENKLVRLDMSEFMTLDSINILRGQNQNERGVFGHYYDRSQRSGTMLFDEIEKAHPLILDVFLQILSAARFTVATGETLDLRNYVVVATSNLGSRMLMESKSTDRETLVRRTTQSVLATMRPETYRRFDIQCVFNKLDFETLNRIAQLHLNQCLALIQADGHEILIGAGVLEYVRTEGYSERFGAAEMEKTVIRILGDAVAAAMIENGGRPVRGTIVYDRRSHTCRME